MRRSSLHPLDFFMASPESSDAKDTSTGTISPLPVQMTVQVPRCAKMWEDVGSGRPDVDVSLGLSCLWHGGCQLFIVKENSIYIHLISSTLITECVV